MENVRLVSFAITRKRIKFDKNIIINVVDNISIMLIESSPFKIYFFKNAKKRLEELNISTRVYRVINKKEKMEVEYKVPQDTKENELTYVEEQVKKINWSGNPTIYKFYCMKCNAEVKEEDERCSKCNAHLASVGIKSEKVI